MKLEDTPKVVEIEKEAFPENWAPTAFHRELRNKYMSYLVALKRNGLGDFHNTNNGSTLIASSPEMSKSSPDGGGLKEWLSNFRHFFVEEKSGAPADKSITGFVGVWFMLDEAHITSIAVEGLHRRKGIGELLMISSIELASLRNSRVVTLEVRASNRSAQLLYEKYGFHRAGVRRGYYTDNNEDAFIMTTEDIGSFSYRAGLQRLKMEHQAKWGESIRILA
ncbi:MAG: ribosomal protein S18-alanine N-acetyltransferase [Chloroflexi bacterium]|nr:ribosomal protein S18-alanine N-acetyltransferase [Chloroflexota bacterium]